jgi:hypothetical protein
MNPKLILIIPILLCFNLSAQRLTVDDLVYSHLGPVYRDAGKFGLPWGKHEGVLRGVPESYDWANGARPSVWMNHGSNQGVTGWGQVYEMGPNSPEKNVRVQLRNFKMYVYAHNEWILVEEASTNIQGSWYSEDFTSSSPGINYRAEPESNGGGCSFNFREGYNVHFWVPKWPRSSLPAGYQAFFIVCEARLIPNTNPNVDLSKAKYLMGVSADSYPTTTSSGHGPWPSLSINRHKFVTDQWDTYCSYISGPVPTSVQGYRDQILSRPLPPGVAAKSINITKPSKSDIFVAPAEITFEVSADADQAEITKVLYFADDTKIGESLSEPFQFIWQNVQTGNYHIKAIMLDSEADSISSKTMEIKVTASLPPTISFVSPQYNSVHPEQEDLTFTVHTTDQDGIVTKVIYLLDEEIIAEIDTHPFSFTWQGLTLGNYILTAIAIDDSDTRSEPAKISFTVGGCDMGTNLVSNAEFDSDLSGWRTWYAGGHTFTTSVVENAGLSGEKSLWVKISEASNIEGIRLFRRFNLEAETTYRICFMAKVESAKKIKVGLKEKGLNAAEFWSAEIEILPGITSYGPYIFHSTKTYNDGEVIFYLGSNTADIWLDKIWISDGQMHPPALPRVVITSPATGYTMEMGSSINLTATVEDSWGAITRVELFSGEQKLSSTQSRPYQFSLAGLPIGEHLLYVVATNDNLHTNASEPVSVVVKETTTSVQSYETEFLIYPNPIGKNADVMVRPPWEITTIEVYNPYGQMVMSSGFMGLSEYQIPGIYFQSSGIYLLRFVSDLGSHTAKLLVK